MPLLPIDRVKHNSRILLDQMLNIDFILLIPRERTSDPDAPSPFSLGRAHSFPVVGKEEVAGLFATAEVEGV